MHLTDLEDMFLHSIPASVLLQINHPEKEHYASGIARDVDCTYSHVVKVIQRLEDHGLVKTNKEGRKNVVTLTDKGEDVVKPLSDLMHALKN